MKQLKFNKKNKKKIQSFFLMIESIYVCICICQSLRVSEYLQVSEFPSTCKF